VTPDFKLTPQHLDAFTRDGLVCLEGLLPAPVVAAARHVVLRPLERLGLWKDGAWRLDAVPRPQWPQTGPKTREMVGNRHPELAALVEEPGLVTVVDALLDGRAHERPGSNRRPQVLFSLPNAETWTAPSGWHSDVPRLASGQGAGVQLFACLATVDPGGGGTLAIAGSHRLANTGRPMTPSDVNQHLRREPFFADLMALYAPPGGREVVGRTGTVGDAPLRVVEMTGAPGDVWLMDLRVLHTAAPNIAERPRVMLTYRYVRSDLLDEIARTYGWA
jgi:hypothetical protein